MDLFLVMHQLKIRIFKLRNETQRVFGFESRIEFIWCSQYVVTLHCLVSDSSKVVVNVKQQPISCVYLVVYHQQDI